MSAAREVAWAWRTGVIEFGAAEPDGALPIARGPGKKLRAVVEALARHAYDGKTLLVPGIPEAANSNAAVDALLAFQAQVLRRLLPARGHRA